MRYFDLHCDTVSSCYNEKKSIYDGDLQVNVVKSKIIEKYEQCFALWLNDELRGDAAFSLCKNFKFIFHIHEKCIHLCENLTN